MENKIKYFIDSDNTYRMFKLENDNVNFCKKYNTGIDEFHYISEDGTLRFNNKTYDVVKGNLILIVYPISNNDEKQIFILDIPEYAAYIELCEQKRKEERDICKVSCNDCCESIG